MPNNLITRDRMLMTLKTHKNGKKALKLQKVLLKNDQNNLLKISKNN